MHTNKSSKIKPIINSNINFQSKSIQVNILANLAYAIPDYPEM